MNLGSLYWKHQEVSIELKKPFNICFGTNKYSDLFEYLTIPSVYVIFVTRKKLFINLVTNYG